MKNKLMGYFAQIGARRVIWMAIGDILLSIGVAMMKWTYLGMSSFDGMVISVADVLGWPFANFQVLLNLVLFILQVTWGRKYIGVGTVMNMFLNGYLVTFFYWVFTAIFGDLVTMPIRLLVMVIAILVISLGLAFYQSANVGVAPYDALSLMMTDYMKKSHYFWNRVATDVLCVIVTMLCGGIIGIGTAVAAFGLGFIIDFFTKHVAEPTIYPESAKVSD